MTVVFAYRSPAPNHREHQEKEPCYLQPEHMQHAACTPKSDASSPIKGPNPAIFAGLAARDPQKCPSLGAQIVG